MFTFDQSLFRYRDGNGDLVPAATIRKYVVHYTDAVAMLLSMDAERLRSNYAVDTLNAWSVDTRAQLSQLHYACGMVAYGGRGQMNSEAWSNAENVIGTQLNYFSHFALQIASGAIAIDGRFANRAAMYGRAGYSTYENLNVYTQEFAGMKWEKRILGDADHCPDCFSEADRGWQPIGTLRFIGDSECTVNCKCHKIFSDSEDAPISV